MCVRYTLSEPKKAIESVAAHFGANLNTDAYDKPRYNVGLAQKAPIIVGKHNGVVLETMSWGFSNKLNASSLLANARVETITQLPTFKDAVVHRRCVIPANGFFEFQDLGKRKQPYLFTLKDEKPLAIAGVWKSTDDLTAFQFCLVTTRPNSLVATIHDRMPVILGPKGIMAWLNGEELERSTLDDIALSFPADAMVCRRVSSYVNNVRNEGPECIKEDVALPELF
jgi:putative SOS response-associated peptidase YedK